MKAELVLITVLAFGTACADPVKVMTNDESHNSISKTESQTRGDYLNLIPDEDVRDYVKIMQILSKPRSTLKVKHGFTWKNCSNTADLVKIDKLMLGPDKLKIPGTVNVTATGAILAPIGSPLQLSLKVKKKVFAWIDIPCIDNMGSCDYDDICEMIQQISCPTALPDCYCPYPAGMVNFNNLPVDVDIPGIPSWLSEGEYEIEARASSKGQQVFCLKMGVTLA